MTTEAPKSSGPSTAVVQPPAQTQAAGYASGTTSLFLLGMGFISNPGSELQCAEGEDLALHIVRAPLEVYGHNAVLGKGASHCLMEMS